MLIQPISVSPWQANCYVVVTDEASKECLIVDPGITGADAVRSVLAQRQLVPVALLGTHGHVDHIGDAHLLADEFGIPLYLAAADHRLVEHPAEGLGPQGASMVKQFTGSETLPAIEDLRDWGDGLHAAGLTVTPFAAPGHTPGCTLLEVTGPDGSVVFTGDVIFAGTIGRTDLPGGNMTTMRESLQRIAQHFPAETTLLPGHGQPTTLARELEANPYLQPDSL